MGCELVLAGWLDFSVLVLGCFGKGELSLKIAKKPFKGPNKPVQPVPGRKFDVEFPIPFTFLFVTNYIRKTKKTESDSRGKPKENTNLEINFRR